jgi:hypothetical protein
MVMKFYGMKLVSRSTLKGNGKEEDENIVVRSSLILIFFQIQPPLFQLLPLPQMERRGKKTFFSFLLAIFQRKNLRASHSRCRDIILNCLFFSFFSSLHR